MPVTLDSYVPACLLNRMGHCLFQLAEWCSWFVSPSSPAPFSIPAKSVCSLTSAPVMLISPYCPCSCSVSLPLPIFQDSVYAHLFCEAISLLHLHLSLHSLNYYLYLVPHCLALSCPSSISCFFILSYLLEFKPCKSHDWCIMCFFWFFFFSFFCCCFLLWGEEYHITLFEGLVQIKELKEMIWYTVNFLMI